MVTLGFHSSASISVPLLCIKHRLALIHNILLKSRRELLNQCNTNFEAAGEIDLKHYDCGTLCLARLPFVCI